LVVAAGSGLIVGLLRRSEPVRVTNVPTPTAAEAAACRKLAGLLPSTIGDGLKKRVVHPSSPLLHAWGTPAAVLRCGVGYPPGFPSAGEAAEVDGITWVSTVASGALIYTSIERTPRVSLAIPTHYQIAGDLLISITPALKQATTAN
jgi:hypothetical protein